MTSLATGLWFSTGPPVSSTNKADHHDITELLLKVALNTIKQTNKQTWNQWYYRYSYICFIPWPTSRIWQWGADKNKTL